MVRSGKNYAIASSTFQLGEIGDDIQLPGAETFDKRMLREAMTLFQEKKIGQKLLRLAAIRMRVWMPRAN